MKKKLVFLFAFLCIVSIVMVAHKNVYGLRSSSDFDKEHEGYVPYTEDGEILVTKKNKEQSCLISATSTYVQNPLNYNEGLQDSKYPLFIFDKKDITKQYSVFDFNKRYFLTQENFAFDNNTLLRSESNSYNTFEIYSNENYSKYLQSYSISFDNLKNKDKGFILHSGLISEKSPFNDDLKYIILNNKLPDNFSEIKLPNFEICGITEYEDRTTFVGVSKIELIEYYNLSSTSENEIIKLNKESIDNFLDYFSHKYMIFNFHGLSEDEINEILYNF